MTYDKLLIVANAFELAVSFFAFMLLAKFVVSKWTSLKDAWGRFARGVRPSVQGSGYDLAIAIAVIFLGKIIRTEAVWYWRVFGEGQLQGEQIVFGITISTLGAVCLVRVLLPSKQFNAYWILMVLGAAAFAWLSYYVA